MSDHNASSSYSVPVPESEAVLLMRLNEIAGLTIEQLAQRLNVFMPADLSQHKGWFGQLLEKALGADAGSQALPDFTQLGIELKTLPLNALGQPKESTYVCTVSLQQNGELTWQDSWVRRKLAKVLWVPVEADSTIPFAQRLIGLGFIWEPTESQQRKLQTDWEELMDQIVLGGQEDLSAKVGEYLQIRPKAANSRIVRKGTAADGSELWLNPKGFYLRTCFTQEILATIHASQ